MPFTPAHVAAVLPLMRGRPARYLVPSGLAIGAMTPDLPLFLPRWAPVGDLYAKTHQPWGVPTWDLAIGALALVAWWVARGPLLDLAPRFVRDRVTLPPRPRLSRWPWLAVSLVVGAATHVLWDSFTHEGRDGVDLVPWLQESTAGLPHFKVAQYVSGVVGLGVVVLVTTRALRQASAAHRSSVLGPTERRRALTVMVGLVTALVVFFAVQLVGQSSLTLELVAYLMVTRAIGSMVGVVGLWTVVWHVLCLRRARADLST